MPTVRVVSSPGAITVVYLNDAAVGRGGVNRREDVLLVQYFLNAMWGKLRDKAGKTFGSGAAPKVDGVCGPITVGAIETFQKWYYEGAFADGRVDFVPPGHRTGSLSNNPYTILGINVNYGFTFGRDRHLALFREPNFPAVLTPSLFA
ncbi:MAG TPA: hypothetical protein VHD15_08145 [Hyphomicrobiales bacterium]|nr:hypothetical protein [Hyphomicrobiales bacterium]